MVFFIELAMTSHQTININCIDFLNDSPFCPQFDLMFADPPFNIGHGYQGFDDRLSPAEYMQFTKRWIMAYWGKLKPGGAMVLHGSPKVARLITCVLFQQALEEYIETEIVWAYNFGQCQFTNFIQTHCRATVVRKPGKRKWYVDNVLTESKRLLMGDKRVSKSKYGGYIPFGTVWGVDSIDGMVVEPSTGELNWGRVQGNNSERREGHPNQLPERYLERVIKAYSQPGDILFDGFGGSGTTIAVAKELDRSCITTDVSEWNCKSIDARLLEGTKTCKKTT